MTGEGRRALLAWYRRNRRDFPWRRTRDPYRILVSEVMLQQTQASRVVPRYERFLGRFPTVERLAASPVGDVIREWSGLGYNIRAKRLHETSGLVASNGWPRTVDGLRRLPGIGPYTAAAVASFAFGEEVAVVDTNVRRVLSRWHGRPLRGAELQQAADGAAGSGETAEWNQAMMELGAVLCRPRRPACTECPVTSWCADPEIYDPPPPQRRFEGSVRQVRGEILRRLATGPLSRRALEDTCAAGDRFDTALRSLLDDGLVTSTGSRYALP